MQSFTVCVEFLILDLSLTLHAVFFQAYPIIFGGTYGFNAGQQGLAFLPIGIGAMFAGGIYLYCRWSSSLWNVSPY